MSDIVLFGAGSTAEVVTAYLEAHTEHRVIAYTVDQAYLHTDRFNGQPLVAWEALPAQYPPGRVELLGPLGYHRMNRIRRERYLQAKAAGYRFASYVHPSVELLQVDLGDNCVILGDVRVEPYTHIGSNVTIWSKAHIGHHTWISDHCFIGPGAGLGGRSHVGERCVFAPHAALVPGVRLGNACFLGPNALVLKDAADNSVFVIRHGTPLATYGSERLERFL